MVLYIINLLHDNLKTNNNMSGYSNIGYAPMQDARYIASFAGIKKTTDTETINSKLINIFEIIKKYSVSTIDTLSILDIMVGNDHNSWIVEKYYKNSNCEEIALDYIVNDILKRNRSYVLDNLYNVSQNLRNIILQSTFRKIRDENRQSVLNNNLHDVS